MRPRRAALPVAHFDTKRCGDAPPSRCSPSRSSAALSCLGAAGDGGATCFRGETRSALHSRCSLWQSRSRRVWISSERKEPS
jgi:hypothetical protein